MAILPIIIAPDARLKRISEPVTRVDNALRRLMDDMLETMREAPGIGLAAVQVGVARRLIVVDVIEDGERSAPLFLVNPEISWASPERMVCDEGCLSLPDHYAEVERPAAVRIGFRDYHGVAREMDTEGVLATCIQHEIDHLDGILFVDHVSAIKRNMILRKLVKSRKLAAVG